MTNGPLTEETRAAIERMDQFHAFWIAHYADFQVQYPDEFVAIINQQVLGHSKDFLSLTDDLEARPEGRSGLQLRFVRVNSPSLVL